MGCQGTTICIWPPVSVASISLGVCVQNRTTTGTRGHLYLDLKIGSFKCATLSKMNLIEITCIVSQL